MRVPQDEVPVEFRRKAAQHLETIRGTPMAPAGSEDAAIVGEVCPLYRPDLGDDVAYWEFEIDPGVDRRFSILTSRAAEVSELVTAAGEAEGPRPAGDADTPLPGGFVIVSTGEHDVPVPHWSLEREPVSRQLERQAERDGKRVARIYKIDALAYVGEDESGANVAQSGQIPVPVSQIATAVERGPREISSLTAKPDKQKDEGQAKDTKHVAKRSGPEPPKLELDDPKDWGKFKEGYADGFAPFLDALKRRAEGPWKVDKLVREFGEGVMADEPHRVALLDDAASIKVSGKGASLVEVELDEKGKRKPAVKLKAKHPSHEKELDFQLDIRYPNGKSETLQYFIVSRKTPSNERAHRDLVTELE